VKLDRENLCKTATGLAVTVVLALGLGLAVPAVFSPTGSGIAPARAAGDAELLKAGALGDMELGRKDAPVTIIEYASMTCPHCANFHTNVYPELKRRYIDTGKVRFIYREYPLDNRALAAAMLTRCAPREKFFPLVKVFFERQKTWARSADPAGALLKIAKFAGFTSKSFNECLKNEKIAKGVLENKAVGSKFKVEATPSFFINGKLLRGGFSVEDLDAVIKPHLPG